MRRRKVVKRELIPDVKYNSELVARLINTIMSHGKKSTAQRIVYGALDLIDNGRNASDLVKNIQSARENFRAKPYAF